MPSSGSSREGRRDADHRVVNSGGGWWPPATLMAMVMARAIQ